MVIKVEAMCAGEICELHKSEKNDAWIGEIKIPNREPITGENISYYPVVLRTEDEAGNIAVKTISDAEIGEDLLLIVREADLFPMKFIVANAVGEELEFVKCANKIDMDIGNTNDFEIELNVSNWNQEYYNYGHQIYIPATEYGGLIEDCKISTSRNIITWTGYTWRGLLKQKVIQPPAGSTHLIESGEANKVIKRVMGERFGSLFVVDETDSQIMISNYQFDRYCTLLDGLEKMLSQKAARLKIYYQQGERLEYGAVHLCAVPVTDWSDRLEYSQDWKIDFSTRDNRRGINHLICAGEGEGIDRTILHLYVQKDGSIGTVQHYTALAEREAVYSYTSQEDIEKLKEDGTKRLKELMNYKEMDTTIDNVEVDIGDIIGGRERITGMEIKKPVVGKIVKSSNGNVTIDYKIKGDEKSGI